MIKYNENGKDEWVLDTSEMVSVKHIKELREHHRKKFRFLDDENDKSAIETTRN